MTQGYTKCQKNRQEVVLGYIESAIICGMAGVVCVSGPVALATIAMLASKFIN